MRFLISVHCWYCAGDNLPVKETSALCPFFFLSTIVFPTVPASIKGALCQNKYKVVLMEIFNGKFVLYAFLSIFFIFTSCRCNLRNERRSKEGVVGLRAFPRQQPHGSSSEVVIFTISKLSNVHCTYKLSQT